MKLICKMPAATCALKDGDERIYAGRCLVRFIREGEYIAAYEVIVQQSEEMTHNQPPPSTSA